MCRQSEQNGHLQKNKKQLPILTHNQEDVIHIPKSIVINTFSILGTLNSSQWSSQWQINYVTRNLNELKFNQGQIQLHWKPFMASSHTTGHWQCPSSLHFPPVALDPSSLFTLCLPPLRNNLFLKTNLDYNPVWRPNSPWLCNPPAPTSALLGLQAPQACNHHKLNPPASMPSLLGWQVPQACNHHELITQWIPRLKISRKSRSRFVYYNDVIWKIPFRILLTATDLFKSRFISNKQFIIK